MLKFLVYIFSAIIVIWSMDGVNINFIFKKGKILQAKVFYIILVLVFTYLLANFIYDFVYIKLF